MAALPNALARLAYIAGLVQSDGTYAHWGVQRTHGDAAAQPAMKQVHRETLLELLRTPLRKLDREELGELEGLPAVYLLPTDHSKASAAHLNSALAALVALQHSRSQERQRDA